MFLDYNLDIEKKSTWKIAHPSAEAGRFPFTINEAGVFYAKQSYYTKRSEKDDYLILYTFSGEGELDYLGRKWPLTEGSAAVIDCYMDHSYNTKPFTEKIWGFYWMHVGGDYCGRYYDLLGEKEYQIVDLGIDGDMIKYFQDAIGLIDYVNELSFCVLSNCMSQIFTKLAASRNFSPEIRGSREHLIRQAVEYIKKNYDKPFSIEAMSRHLNLSKYYLIKLFGKHIGVTPYHYLIMHRIAEAKKLLRATDYKIIDVGRAVGFADESNFCKTFNRLAGQSPSQYREGEK